MPDGTTPLFVAAQNGHLEIVKYFLKQKIIQTTKPLKKTQDALKTFASNKSSSVEQEMNHHIENYKLKYPGATTIEITPEEIAKIMGHSIISQAFNCLDTTLNTDQDDVNKFKF